jgi:hypothetical protein
MSTVNPENFGYADKVVRLGLDLGVQGADGQTFLAEISISGRPQSYIKRRTAHLSLLL